MAIRITWDEPKRQANLKHRDLDFAMLDGTTFFEEAIVAPARDGRFLALGRLGGRPYAVVFKPLGSEALSVISLRIASKKERRRV